MLVLKHPLYLYDLCYGVAPACNGKLEVFVRPSQTACLLGLTSDRYRSDVVSVGSISTLCHSRSSYYLGISSSWCFPYLLGGRFILKHPLCMIFAILQNQAVLESWMFSFTVVSIARTITAGHGTDVCSVVGTAIRHI